eukprot:1956420-Amphidinium_carterae.2
MKINKGTDRIAHTSTTVTPSKSPPRLRQHEEMTGLHEVDASQTTKYPALVIATEQLNCAHTKLAYISANRSNDQIQGKAAQLPLALVVVFVVK